MSLITISESNSPVKRKRFIRTSELDITMNVVLEFYYKGNNSGVIYDNIINEGSHKSLTQARIAHFLQALRYVHPNFSV